MKAALEKTAHLVAPKGYVVCYKTDPAAEQEIAAAAASARRVGLVLADQVTYTLGAEVHPRRLVIYQKR